MRALLRSQFAASVLGGIVVAGSFLGLGITGHRTTRTIVEQSPVGVQPVSDATALTPHGIYERDAPGVVLVKALVTRQVEDPFDLYAQRDQDSSTGSGFLIGAGGYIVTAFHVIAGADARVGVSVRFADAVSRRAIVVGEDQNDDLALLKADMSGVPSVRPLRLGDSTSVRVGDPTLAIGNPFGTDRTLTSGIVSALQRRIQAPDGFVINNVIQTDAPVNPGTSGGPLLDAAGRVIGINSQIPISGGDANGSAGISFAVPVDTAKRLLPRLKRGGHATLAFLGRAKRHR